MLQVLYILFYFLYVDGLSPILFKLKNHYFYGLMTGVLIIRLIMVFHRIQV